MDLMPSVLLPNVGCWRVYEHCSPVFNGARQSACKSGSVKHPGRGSVPTEQGCGLGASQSHWRTSQSHCRNTPVNRHMDPWHCGGCHRPVSLGRCIDSSNHARQGSARSPRIDRRGRSHGTLLPSLRRFPVVHHVHLVAMRMQQRYSVS